MINFKKADAYFKKVPDKGGRIIKWTPNDGFVWVASDYVAVLYPWKALPFNPTVALESPQVEAVVKNAAAVDKQQRVTNFVWLSGRTPYCVLTGYGLIKKDFVDILNTDLLVSNEKGTLYSAFDSGQLVGFATGYRGPDDMWEALK